MTSGPGSSVNLDDGAPRSVVAHCVFGDAAFREVLGGEERPRDMSAIAACADDDENVVHLVLIERRADCLDLVDDELARVVGVRCCHACNSRKQTATVSRNRKQLP